MPRKHLENMMYKYLMNPTWTTWPTDRAWLSEKLYRHSEQGDLKSEFSISIFIGFKGFPRFDLSIKTKQDMEIILNNNAAVQHTLINSKKPHTVRSTMVIITLNKPRQQTYSPESTHATVLFILILHCIGWNKYIGAKISVGIRMYVEIFSPEIKRTSSIAHG